MNKKAIKITDLMPKIGKDLIAYSGQNVLEKIGTDIIKEVLVSTLCGENIRNLTEDLTKRRIAIINGALLVLFIRGCSHIDNFVERLPTLIAAGLKKKNSKVDKAVLLWLLGLTEKGVQNILRGKETPLKDYIKRLDNSVLKINAECLDIYGDLKGAIILNKESVNVDWPFVLGLFRAIGTQTLAIRGAEKSMYGKLFERLLLGSCLSILGFKKINKNQESDRNKVFWLSSREDKRESDATVLYKQGQGVRFDIGFIGPGNSEISLDKVSRFERTLEHGRQKHYMATFIVVDRIGEGSRIQDLAKLIDGTIIQMSMAFWPREIAKKLGAVLGFKHELQDMPDNKVESYIRRKMGSILINDFV